MEYIPEHRNKTIYYKFMSTHRGLNQMAVIQQTTFTHYAPVFSLIKISLKFLRSTLQ